MRSRLNETLRGESLDALAVRDSKRRVRSMRASVARWPQRRQQPLGMRKTSRKCPSEKTFAFQESRSDSHNLLSVSSFQRGAPRWT
jgi:hypothetical protein